MVRAFDRAGAGWWHHSCVNDERQSVPGPDDAALIAELLERETAFGLLRRAKTMASRRHFAQAAVLLERAARLEPGKGSIVEALARARFNGGDPAAAAAAFAELLEIDPASAYAHYGLARCLRRLGRPSEAREHLRVAIALAPHSRLYRQALAGLD
jgi:Flp pilus assembly protein TadD